MNSKKLNFSKDAREELGVLMNAVTEIVVRTCKVFENQDAQLARTIEPLEEVIDELNQELKTRHINRLQEGQCTIEMGFILSDVTTSLERIADHCSNVAVCIMQVQEDAYDTHSFLGQVRSGKNEEFEAMLEKERSAYVLPKAM